MYQISPNSLLDSFCMMVVFIMAIYNYMCINDKKRGTSYFFFIVLITLFSLYYRPAGGDFWHYLEAYELGVDYPYHHMEDFYYWVMGLIPNNYLLWRFAIWLPAAIIIAIIFKILKMPSSIATCFFLLLALIDSYYYTRNVLALSILYLAIALYCMRDNFAKKTINTIFFFGLVFASWFLHKSMPVYIILALLSIFLPLNKKYVAIALVAFPLLYGGIMLWASDFISTTQLWLMEGSGEIYLESENTFAANWKGVLSLIIGYAPVTYFYAIAFHYPLSKNNPTYYPFKVFLLYAFFLFFISFLFLGQGSIAIQARLYKSSMLPLAFVVCLFFKNNFGSKQCTYFIYLLAIKYATSLFLEITT